MSEPDKPRRRGRPRKQPEPQPKRRRGRPAWNLLTDPNRHAVALFYARKTWPWALSDRRSAKLTFAAGTGEMVPVSPELLKQHPGYKGFGLKVPSANHADKLENSATTLRQKTRKALRDPQAANWLKQMELAIEEAKEASKGTPGAAEKMLALATEANERDWAETILRRMRTHGLLR